MQFFIKSTGVAGLFFGMTLGCKQGKKNGELLYYVHDIIVIKNVYYWYLYICITL